MIILECRHIPGLLGETIVILNNTCVVQHTCEYGAILNEYTIPILFSDNKYSGIRIKIDESIVSFINSYKIVKIFETFMDFGNVIYKFTISDDIILDTRLPELVCICDLPDLHIDQEVTLRTMDTYLHIELDNGITYFINCFYIKKSKNIIRINGKFLQKNVCKIYIGYDSPMCFETLKDNKKTFIAPIEKNEGTDSENHTR